MLRLRNAKNRAFLSLAGRFGNHLLVRYEDVAAQPEAFVAAFKRLHGLKGTPEFHPVLTERGHTRKQAFEPKTYVPLSDADLAFIWSGLDPTLEAELGCAPAGSAPPQRLPR